MFLKEFEETSNWARFLDKKKNCVILYPEALFVISSVCPKAKLTVFPSPNRKKF